MNDGVAKMQRHSHTFHLIYNLSLQPPYSLSGEEKTKLIHKPNGRCKKCLFLSDTAILGVQSMRASVSNSLTIPFADLTDVTLADEDNNSIPTDDVNRTIIGNVAMQVAPPGGQTCN